MQTLRAKITYILLIVAIFIAIGILCSINNIAFADEEPNTYTITWVNWDNSILFADQVAEGDTPEYYLDAPTKASDAQYTYTFTGWSPEITAAYEDATYIAQFSQIINEYVVTIYTNSLDDPTPILDANVAYGTILKSVLDSYTLANKYYVYYDEAFKYIDINQQVISDINVIREEGIDFVLKNNTTIVDEKVVTKDRIIQLTTYSDNELYNYKYFYYDLENSVEGKEIVSLDVGINSKTPGFYLNKVQIIQKSEKKQVKITNDYNSNSFTVYYKEQLGQIFPAPTKEGYTFKGWYYNNKQVTASTYADIEGEMKLISVWEANSYYITFNPNNGESPVQEKVTFDSQIKGIQPSYTGYDFIGWYEGETKWEIPTIMTAAYNLTLEAKWQAIEYTMYLSTDIYKTHDFDHIESFYEVNVPFESENISLYREFVLEFEKDNYIFGAYYIYTDDNNVEHKVVIANEDLIISKWTFAKNMNIYLSSMPKAATFDGSLYLKGLDGYNYVLTFDGKEQNTGEELYCNEIGYHQVIIKNGEDVVVEKSILIKEVFSFESEQTYEEPIYLTSLNAKVLVDGVEVDSSTFRIDKNGTHEIVVLGANDYSATYIVTFENKNIARAWWIFGISMGVGLFIIALAIYGRRRVVRYDGDRI